MRSRRMHKQWIVLLLALVLPLLALADDQATSLFKKGNVQYEKGRYEEALKSYQEVLDKGYQNAELYYNLGNAHYKMGEMPAAVLNYEKAQKLEPGDEDIRLNLQLANSKITDKFEALPEFFLSRWWNAWVLHFSADTWSVISVSCIFLGSVLLIVYLFALVLPLKKSAFYSGIVLVFAGLFSLMMSGLQHRHFESHDEAIVFSGTVPVKAGPAAGEKTLLVIHEGTKVGIKARKNNWIRVTLPNGNEGWIGSAEVREI
ncbi:tetratricopeptide repeat protein [Pedobacter sp. GR22-6]|uniref:tetratricopeptide repeat protein n=1 Tax=Pedobacter sp. GR22-6 TaxID=3127957 RepID=UPI00307D8188